MYALTLALLLPALGTAVALLLRAQRDLRARSLEHETLRQRLQQQDAEGQATLALLRTVVEATPVAVVLFSDAGQIRFTNGAARELFFGQAEVEGQNFLSMLERAPEPMRRALMAENDELFTVGAEGENETFHLSKRTFSIAGEAHTLVAVRQMTEEFSRQEIGTLKRVIRLISHEINNSLGPISSLVSSGRLIVKRPEHLPKLEVVFATIDERTKHLISFLDGYARLAKLPPPQPTLVTWEPFLTSLSVLWPRVKIGPAPAGSSRFDPAQIQQVLINLIKNACEAGGAEEEVSLEVERADGGVRVSVLDRGAGMSDEVLQSALLPFFTTKPSGSGLGLALCREIVESHRGRMRLARREGGGTIVSFWLPERQGSPAALTATRARLSLTNG